MRNDFAIFILSYNRPDNIATLKTLQKTNYNSNWYIVISDDDPSVTKYLNMYDNVFVFNKKQIEKTMDIFDDGSGSDKVVVYARNFCAMKAKELGLTYYAQFDDDYTSFEFRYVQNEKLKVKFAYEFNEICDCMIELLDETNSRTVAFAQGGDFIGGAKSSTIKQRVKRKAMNSFFCRTDNPVVFNGRINEDVNMYTDLGMRGELVLTVVDVSLVQKQTQKSKGGMTDTYLEGGTYLKSFYSVIQHPNCVSINFMATTHKRIHHKVNWNYCCPKIINQKYKK